MRLPLGHASLEHCVCYVIATHLLLVHCSQAARRKPAQQEHGATNVDQCETKNGLCHKDAVCYNTRRAFRCRCKPGFYGNGKICIDDNECEYENGGCVHFCTNTNGNYTCSCMTGFQLARGGHNCVDKNECFESRGGCHHQCVNTMGSYQCRCNAGYSLGADGKQCVAGIWCQTRLGCAHHCQSTSAGTVCACRHGYHLHNNKRECIPTCAVGNGGCQHKCSDTTEGPACSCHDKYTLSEDGKTCLATCGVNNGGCDRRCEDTTQGPRCSCPPGYILHQDSRTCLDVNECSEVNGGCSHGCINTHGSFECICPKGYRVQHDLKMCSDVDECETSSSCDHVCTNIEGSYSCACRQGYDIYGHTHCADKNECSENNGGCEHMCVNTEGGFECQCRRGYHLLANKRDCVESVACQTLQAPAKTVMSCRQRGSAHICQLSCQGSSHFTMATTQTYTARCGPDTEYLWSHERQNTSLPTCSDHIAAPGYKRKARFLFFADQCKVRKKHLQDMEKQLLPLLVEDRKCSGLCGVSFLKVQCRSRKRKFRQLGHKYTTQSLVLAEFELQVQPQNSTAKCDVSCARVEGYKRIKRTTKNLRTMIDNKALHIKFEGGQYEVLKQSLKARRIEDICQDGQVLVNDKCVSCSVGSYYDVELAACLPCPPGTFTDQESQLACLACPHGLHGVGLEGARNITECEVQCPPGNYSATGLKPCRPCRVGTYQPNHGKTMCVPCGGTVRTQREGATSFQHCHVRDTCRAGHFYNRRDSRCEQCLKNKYQPESGQDYCLDCPGNTTTDVLGAANSTHCKDRTCGGELGEHQGFIESPNWPGPYPSDVECTWKIKPQKGRRILIIIPEIFLASQDKCGDILVMRKSHSPYSVTTYETCESTETPIAFTARSRKLWINFRTNHNNSAKGFTIPYVTYNEEYQDLIEDIVRDGRLYSSYQHQEVLKDRKLLSALLEVIAQPYNYFKYANISRSMFPASFIRLLRNKVLRFFDLP